jgi:hypothetical protein
MSVFVLFVLRDIFSDNAEKHSRDSFSHRISLIPNLSTIGNLLTY